MIANNPMSPVCEYATDSQYKEAPNQEQLSCGVIPLDSLPAEWWNYLWGNANQQINNGVVALNNVIAEIINVMSAAGISPVSECTDQLKTSIQLLAQCIGTSTKAGAVKSSSTCGQVSISDTGIMTANGLGNAANLTTTNKGNVVAAINELKSQHEQQITDLESYVQGLQNSTVTGVKINSSGTVLSPSNGIINLGLGSAAKCDISCFLSTESLAAYAKQNGYFTGASDSWVCCSCDSARLVGSSATYTADDIKTALDGKAPTNHASSSTTYGVASSSNYGHVKFQDISCSLSNIPVIKREMGGCICASCGYYNFTCYQCSLVWLCLNRRGCSCSSNSIILHNCTPYPLMILKTIGYCVANWETISCPILLPGKYELQATISSHCTYGYVCVLVAPFKGVPFV